MLTEKYDIFADISEAYRYMGGGGEMDERTKAELLDAASLVHENARPGVVIKACELDRGGGLALKGTCLRLEGRAVEALLHGCGSCVIFCATIGSGVDALIRKWEIKNITFAAMLDACGSSAVERLCDSVEKALSDEYSASGLFLTDRFSPGYGDLPINLQRDFCSVLDTSRRIGVAVGSGDVMAPVKSVTALIGISPAEQKHRVSGCGGCPALESCKFRENGVTCYGQAL